jgi:probable phosphoglycerate mutase
MVGLIYLVRHGEAITNVEKRISGRRLTGDLTPLGREQAARAGEWLQDKGIERILHSPFARAEQTAQVINEGLGLRLEWVDGLREMDAGDLDGRTDGEAWEYFYSIYERWKRAEPDARYPGGESHAEGFARFHAALMQVPTEQTAALVTHGGITISCAPYLCVNAAALQGDLQLRNTGIVVLEPYDIGRYICRAWNVTEHLLAEG